MSCQTCDEPVLVSDERCEKCGAKLLHRVFLGVPKAENFSLTAEEGAARELDEPEEAAASSGDWGFPPRTSAADHTDVRPHAPVFSTEREVAPEMRWGGFFRRLVAYVEVFLDLVLLSALMGFLS